MRLSSRSYPPKALATVASVVVCSFPATGYGQRSITVQQAANVIQQLVQVIVSDHLTDFRESDLFEACRVAAGATGERFANVTFSQYLHRISANDVPLTVELCARGIAGLLPPNPPPYIGNADFDRVFRGERNGGIGLTFASGSLSAQVLSSIEGSPAERAGLQMGDQITEIDGRATAGLGDAEILEGLRGEIGSLVVLQVKRGSSKDPIRFELRREAVAMPVARSSAIGANVIYVALSSTNADALRALQQEVSKHRSGLSAHADTLILDLRLNAGGELRATARIASLFHKDGVQVASLRARDPRKSMSFVSGSIPAVPGEIPKPSEDLKGWFERADVYVLVSGYTASGAEIITRSLQIDRNATVVGAERTRGLGHVQNVFPVLNRVAVKLTTSTLIDRRGQAIDGNGVVPDVAITYETDENGQRKQAIRFDRPVENLESDPAIRTVLEKMQSKATSKTN